MARKILLADDSVTAQNMGRKILTDAGYDVVTVNNGSAALKRVAELKPDLVVLDVYMPGYSGLEVCVRLKDAPETARIPILLTVGKLEPFKPEEATRVRADGFIVKPFEASELLSALTRLEDRVVPAQSEGGRFSSSSAGIERFGASDPSVNRSEDDGDTGWKNRLRFPSKKKKEEPEPEPEPDFVTPSNFRDFRRGGGKAPAGSSPFPLSTAPAAQAPAIVPDIPRDITPEELDALSELAAKLDGAPSPTDEAKIEEKTIPVVATAPEMPRPEFAVPEARIEEARTEAPVTAEVKQELEVPEAAELVNAETVGTPVAARSEEVPTPVAESTTVESEVAEAVAYKTEPAVAQEPAPVDREDEPEFASAVGTISEAQPETDRTTDGEPSVPLETAPVVEPPAAASTIEATPVKESRVEQAAQVDESSKPAASSEPAGSSPSAEELAEALRFLTPAQTPASQTLAEAGAALADKLSPGAGSRWVAEAVPLNADEASASLESEMFRTFARAADGDSASPEAPAISASASERAVTASAVVAEIEVPAASSPVAVEESAGTAENAPVSEPEQSSVKSAEAIPEESGTPATFADAVQDQEEESVSAESVTMTAETQRDQQVAGSENGPGSEEDMAKETKGKDGKSNWHQIRSGAPAAASDAVEAAKQAEDSPKAMAASASADGASDPSAIASIVDSVLADLRPKIVEEIAKQLAKK